MSSHICSNKPSRYSGILCGLSFLGPGAFSAEIRWLIGLMAVGRVPSKGTVGKIQQQWCAAICSLQANSEPRFSSEQPLPPTIVTVVGCFRQFEFLHNKLVQNCKPDTYSASPVNRKPASGFCAKNLDVLLVLLNKTLKINIDIGAFTCLSYCSMIIQLCRARIWLSISFEFVLLVWH